MGRRVCLALKWKTLLRPDAPHGRAWRLASAFGPMSSGSTELRSEQRDLEEDSGESLG